ncbi:MAG: class 1b ribonucleoside-diphosphate reductase subunit alpha [Actinomycetaceae bacterium]|nr:class 1b ribonucleoside-diphosphate reductase subunit alpha [Actinomycetaceae bacterium]MDY6082800.1 class 1b ribonucleoside-diphosphate reductase subunit alpha [Actinomycetaceae bacterium]
MNAQLNLYSAQHTIQFDKDELAIEHYFSQHVIPNTAKFASTSERLNWLFTNDYYEREVWDQYSQAFVESLYDRAASANFQFTTFLGAFKFYTSYALKTFDGGTYLEDFGQRAVAVALYLGKGDEALASDALTELLSRRLQPATPTFLNAGKKQRGEMVSCFVLRMEDNMESIGRSINSALQLSKRGGGVAFLLTNIREAGAPIKKIAHQSSGIIPIMKLLEDSFSYANQLGARQGAGAVYLSAHHPDILQFLDTKRENADEKIRIKTLSLGVMIPDITFQLAKKKEKMALFSPYDVFNEYGKPLSDISITEHYQEMIDNPRIHKKYIDARSFFTTLAEIQFESGYPFIVYEDTANRANPIKGRINMSNLCTEIMQVNSASVYDDDLGYATTGQDISCNLASLNIAATMDGGDIRHTVDVAIRGLTTVSELEHIHSVPSIEHGNDAMHAIGLGQMNLHGFLAREGIMYGSPEGLDFTNMYFLAVTYAAIAASNRIAIERGATFAGFEDSKYASGEYFDKYTDKIWEPATEKVRQLVTKFHMQIPTHDEWVALKESVMKHGIYNAYLQAVPPTGSISYINGSTASLQPIVSKIEIRKEGKIGRVYYPAPYMTNDNQEYYLDAYELGYKAIVDTYAAAAQHVDQGTSMTLFFMDDVTTRVLNKAQIYAWTKGLKSIYYVRLRQQALEGTQVEQCVSCML